MEMWSQDYIDHIEPDYIKLDEEGSGEFVFGVVSGLIDVRGSLRKPFLEYSWQSVSDSDEHRGRRWFEFQTAEKGEGKLLIHCGDESAIKIERKTKQTRQVPPQKTRSGSAQTTRGSLRKTLKHIGRRYYEYCRI